MSVRLYVNLFFIDSMQFMNSSLDALVKNLSDNDFKYLSKEFSDDLLLKVSKTKERVLVMNIGTVLKDFSMIGCPIGLGFIVF